MLYVYRLEWDDWNEELIARHSVSPDEVEEAVFDNSYDASRARNEIYRLIGLTNGGRYLALFLAPRSGELFYEVRARDASDGERCLYRQRVS